MFLCMLILFLYRKPSGTDETSRDFKEPLDMKIKHSVTEGVWHDLKPALRITETASNKYC